MVTKALDVFAIVSAIGSAGFWLASYKLSVGLEVKVDRIMMVISSRMQRQQDRSKTDIAILNAEIEEIKNILAACKFPDKISNHLSDLSDLSESKYD